MADRFQRKSQGQKQISDSYLIVCEGETEKYYLEGFRRTLSRDQQRTLKIEAIKATGTDCLSIVKEAIRRKEAAEKDKVPYKQVWVFFDDDNQPNIQNAIDKATSKKNEIKVAYSSICLEVWFLLHFEFTSRSFQSHEDVRIELKKHWHDYTKPAFDSWDRLKANLPRAFENAKKLRKDYADSEDLKHCNPFTNIDLLLSSIGFVTMS